MGIPPRKNRKKTKRQLRKMAEQLVSQQAQTPEFLPTKLMEGDQIIPGSDTYMIGEDGECFAMLNHGNEKTRPSVLITRSGRYPTWYEICSSAQLMPEGTIWAAGPNPTIANSVFIMDVGNMADAGLVKQLSATLSMLADTPEGIMVPIDKFTKMLYDDRMLFYDESDGENYHLSVMTEAELASHFQEKDDAETESPPAD